MPRPYYIENDKIAQILRVNHAGEYGAKRIYEGQRDFIKNKGDKQLIEEMLTHEQEHLTYFSDELVKSQTRPSSLICIWHIGGYCLGAISGLMGIKYSMLVTQSVEEVIEEHYNSQVQILDNTKYEQEISFNIKKFCAEEVEHKNIAQDYNLTSSIFNDIISKSIKKLCLAAIFLSKKI